MRFARGTPEEGLVDKGSVWPSADLRECLDHGHITSHDDGATAHVHFTVAEGLNAPSRSPFTGTDRLVQPRRGRRAGTAVRDDGDVRAREHSTAVELPVDG